MPVLWKREIFHAFAGNLAAVLASTINSPDPFLSHDKQNANYVCRETGGVKLPQLKISSIKNFRFLFLVKNQVTKICGLARNKPKPFLEVVLG